jgi:hypothetical protein
MGKSEDWVEDAERRIKESHEQEMRFLRRWRKRAEGRARSVSEAAPPLQRGWFHMPERRPPDDAS